MFWAARLSWRNSPDPKGPKGKAVLGPLWASHLAAWQHTATSSASLLPATLHCIKAWAGPWVGGASGLCSWRSYKSQGGCRSGVFSFCRGKGTQNAGRSLDIRPLGPWLLIITKAVAITTCYLSWTFFYKALLKSIKTLFYSSLLSIFKASRVPTLDPPTPKGHNSHKFRSDSPSQNHARHAGGLAKGSGGSSHCSSPLSEAANRARVCFRPGI